MRPSPIIPSCAVVLSFIIEFCSICFSSRTSERGSYDAGAQVLLMHAHRNFGGRLRCARLTIRANLIRHDWATEACFFRGRPDPSIPLFYDSNPPKEAVPNLPQVF